MVKICSYDYPREKEEEYKEYYDNYSYKLHDFQKWSIEAIVTGNHVLVCCPTGSGKTMPGEFAIDYLFSKGKKTIYTTPIKALSNEKFYSFTQKYPHIRIGLVTGDIKMNPDADVIICTTEILMNKLYQINSDIPVTNSSISFELDIQNELGCVVFDEIHMINDESRGHAWEQSIMMLPSHVQLVGLSATLDNPERFAFWLENKGNCDASSNKVVYLTRKQERAVPLIHYSFITNHAGVFKTIKDKAIQQEIRDNTNKLLVLQDAKGKINDVSFSTMHKILNIYDKHDIRIKRQHILNKLAEYLVEKEMLPALCYVFSRKQLEKCAEELTTNILEFDSKVPYIVDRECEKIIRKLPNYEEYLHLPEYTNTVKLLRKGVGIHHAGLMPILREMTELLFARGYIKILFCTETMSVGINLPVKTTIFTEINKFNGEIVRPLYSHEYTQAAGRAGRLGHDTVGHVIHLNNLFRDIELVNYKRMMDGKPQALQSKFKISFSLVLNLLSIGDQNITQFAKRSMVTTDLNNQQTDIQKRIDTIQTEVKSLQITCAALKTPRETIEEYIDLKKKAATLVNKKRKEVDRQLQQIRDNFKMVEQEQHTFEKLFVKQREILDLQIELERNGKYLFSGVDNVLHILNKHLFINLLTNESNEEENQKIELTLKGRIASQLKESHCLVFSSLIEDNTLDSLDTEQIVALFSCFTNINVKDELRSIQIDNASNVDIHLKNIIYKTTQMYSMFQNEEIQFNVHTGIDYSYHYDLIAYMGEWCKCENVEECKFILQKMVQEKEIFLGEFVKAVLKINNISSEIEKVAEMIGNVSLLSKIRQIPALTMKFVVTNQSLYV
jgi:superfamily II RNA helicase